jgi:hypothetical protein
MEPVSTEAMYVEAWRASRCSQNIFEQALVLLKDLPAEKRRSIVETLIREVERDVSNIWDSDGKHGQDEARSIMLEALRPYLEADLREAEAERFLSDLLKRPTQKVYVGNLPRYWGYYNAAEALRMTSNPNHPLVPLAAGSDDPRVRIWIICALQPNPIPRNQRILQELLKDPDENVRNTAKWAEAELAKLAAASPLDYAAAVPAVIPPRKGRRSGGNR